MAEILLMLALNTYQSFNQSISTKIRQACLEMKFGFLNNKYLDVCHDNMKTYLVLDFDASYVFHLILCHTTFVWCQLTF